MKKKTGIWRTIITVILLVLLNPIGIVVMWLFSQWNKKVKIIVSLILALFYIAWGRNLVMFTERYKMDQQVTTCIEECQKTYDVGSSPCSKECLMQVEDFYKKWGIEYSENN